MKKITALISVLVAACMLFSSCGYRISIEKVDKDKTDETTTEQAVEFVPPSYEKDITEESAASENTSESNTIAVDTSYKSVAMDVAGVLAFYKKSVDNVKVRCPGFTKKETQDITDVTAGNGNVQLANRIVNLVATELLRSSGDKGSAVTVKAHDDIAVLEQFPVFGKGYACNLTDLTLIKSAACYTNGELYKIIIQFNDQLNPEPGESQFGEIMTPIARKNIASGISEYLVVLDLSKYRFDFNYTGCELTCYVDCQTGRVVSLNQKMIIDINIDLDLDLLLFKTNVVQAQGRLINHLEYSDFDWSIGE